MKTPIDPSSKTAGLPDRFTANTINYSFPKTSKRIENKR